MLEVEKEKTDLMAKLTKFKEDVQNKYNELDIEFTKRAK